MTACNGGLSRKRNDLGYDVGFRAECPAHDWVAADIRPNIGDAGADLWAHIAENRPMETTDAS